MSTAPKCPTCLQPLPAAQVEMFRRAQGHRRGCKCTACRGDVKSLVKEANSIERAKEREEAKERAASEALRLAAERTRLHLKQIDADAKAARESWDRAPPQKAVRR